MKLAVMQPYIFPYIGYFQLVEAVDVFVFYDDVTFIKNGWINRNRILVNGNDHYITVPCTKAGSNRLIGEVVFDRERKEFKNLTKTIEQAYKKAPFFDQVLPIIENILSSRTMKISTLAQESIIQIAHYLEISTDFKISSEDFAQTKGLEKADRLSAICKNENAQQYINPIGGKELYDKTYFEKKGIQLDFLKSKPIDYKQFKNEFVTWLSIIDVLMFNSVDQTKRFLNSYELV